MNAFEGNVRLEGERLALRPFGLDDAGALIEVVRAGEDCLPPNFPNVLEPEPIAWFLQEGVHHQREGIARGAERDSDGVSRDMVVFSRIATDPDLPGAPRGRPDGAFDKLVADAEKGLHR